MKALQLESVLIDGVAYQMHPAVAGELLRLHLELLELRAALASHAPDKPVCQSKTADSDAQCGLSIKSDEQTVPNNPPLTEKEISTMWREVGYMRPFTFASSIYARAIEDAANKAESNKSSTGWPEEIAMQIRSLVQRKESSHG